MSSATGQHTGEGKPVAFAERKAHDLRAWEPREVSVIDALTHAAKFWLWQIDSRGTFTYCGSEIANLLGYSPDEVIGKNFFDLVVDEDADRYRAQFESLTQTMTRADEFEAIKLTRSGTPVRIRSLVVPLRDESGSCSGYIGFDRLVMGVLREGGALWELQRGLAHKLNNLFAIILGESELLLDGASDAQGKVLRVIENAVSQATLLNARWQTLQEADHYAQFQNIDTIIAGALELLPCILGKRIALCIDSAPASKVLWCEPSRVYRILLTVTAILKASIKGQATLTIHLVPRIFDETNPRPEGALTSYYVSLTFSVSTHGNSTLEIDSLLRPGLEAYIPSFGGYLYPASMKANAIEVLLPAPPISYLTGTTDNERSNTLKLVSTSRSSGAPPTLKAAPTRGKSSDLQEKIRARAYELYLQHGSTDGHDLSDWLQAESELMN